jgi:hypothetical protein
MYWKAVLAFLRHPVTKKVIATVLVIIAESVGRNSRPKP